jgi:osmotically-inducible protein OsmY
MTMQRDNKELRKKVLNELDWEPSLEADDIGVAVSDGVVTLTGHVPSYAQKRAAERAVLHLASVKGVANDIEVELPEKHERTDTDITKAALRAIDWHSQLPSDDIKVKVQNGWVTLEGTVDWNYQRTKAERAVRYLVGVRGVSNHLKVKSQTTPDDIRSRIKKALERQVDKEADRISITVDEDTVTLRGSVQSWADREDIEYAAWGAPGITEVKNELTVKRTAYA